MHEEGTTSLTEIPFAVAYSNRVNFMESRPPMEDIAELNLKAYQIQSDLDNQLHISAVPMLAFFGFPQTSEEVSAGPGEAIAFPSDGKAEYIGDIEGFTNVASTITNYFNLKNIFPGKSFLNQI